MVIITLKGKVFSGVGEGRMFTDLSWAKKQFQDKMGFQPRSGTLNIRLSGGIEKMKLLKSFKGVEIEPPEGFFGGRCFKALIMGEVNGAVVIPDVSRYPSNVLEVIAPINLREKFNLNDGDEIDLEVWLE